MYFKLPQTPKVLNVDDDFAHLLTVAANGDLNFEFEYSISQDDVVKYKVQKLTINVATRVIPPKPLFGNSQRGVIDTRSLVSNIKSTTIDAKTKQQQQNAYVIASVDCDIAALINNDIMPQLQAGVPLSSIPSLNHPRLTLVSASDTKNNNNPQPVLQTVTNSKAVPNQKASRAASAAANTKALSVEMITRQGLDPSHALNLTPRSSSEYATLGGLSNTSTMQELITDPAAQLMNARIFPVTTSIPPTSTIDVADADGVQVLQSVTNGVLFAKINVLIPKAKLMLMGKPVTQVFVEFDLISSSNGMKINTINKTLDLQKHILVYHTPKTPPQLSVTIPPRSYTGTLEIKQVDTSAVGIVVYKKTLWATNADTDSYNLVGSYQLTSKQQSTKISVDVPTYSSVVYRVIPTGQQPAKGFEYTNVVIKPGRYSPISASVVTVTQIDKGVEVSVRSLPTNAVAVQLLRWNMTTFDSSPTFLNNDVCFIDDASRAADLLTTIDSTVSQDNIYKYAARIIYKDGNVKDVGAAVIEFLQPQNGLVDVQYTNLNVTNDSTPNVTFDLSFNVNSTNMDQIKQMLANQGMSDIFSGDVATQRDELAKLLAFSIDRVDLTSGERESFRIMTATHFDDDALRKNQAIKPLVYGRNYRYEIYPMLRAPETMFDKFVKTSTDPTTLKTYTFSPAKFLHPLALNKGTIVSTNGASQRYAKDPMGFGTVGDVTTIDISMNLLPISLSNVIASNFDRYLNLITWTVVGDITRIDSFLIFKEVHGIRTPIGKSHSQFSSGMCQFMHEITNDDVGELFYVILPVMNDYNDAPEVKTNTLTIESAPS